MKISVALLFALLCKAGTSDAVSSQCTDDVALIYTVGQYEYESLPIAITSQNTDHVIFEVSHQWNMTNLSNFFIEYDDPFTGGRVCLNNANWKTGSSLVMTARCMESVPISVVYLVAMDNTNTLTDTNNAAAPECCEYEGSDRAVQYTFTLQCVPKNCLPG
jgi:hypothetical protein